MVGSLAVGDKRCVMGMIRQAFGEYSQCGLETLNLEGNIILGGLDGAGEYLFDSLAESGIASLHTINLSKCSLMDRVCPSLLKFVTRRKNKKR